MYDKIVCVPGHDEYSNIVSDKLFKYVHNLIKCQINIHHSHVTGEIKGYSHHFCNKNVLEAENPKIPCIAHNLFSFDFFYFMKGFSVTSWAKNDLNIGGNQLNKVNFASIANDIKFIDSLKYYQKSLGEMSSNMEKIEIDNAKLQMKMFLENQDYFSTIWKFLSPIQQLKILTITCEGKGIIPYEKIIDQHSLFISPPPNEFWAKSEFFSELKQRAVTDEEYNDSKFLYETLKIRNLGDLNDLYNMQDVLLLCEMLENRFQFMLDSYGFNPRKYNSASALSSCIEREMSKVILALPTTREHVDIFEKTVMGGFSCVNTRLAFDTKIFLPKTPDNKRDNSFKVVFDIYGEDKRVISKILKLDENNHYGHGMTFPLPTGCIKENPDISWQTFNILLKKLSLKDKTGHLFVVNIKFNKEKAGKKELLYNEIYPAIIEKQIKIPENERSVYQLLDNYNESSRGPSPYRTTEKSHATLLPKKYIPLYLEHLNFLINRCGWTVAKIHKHLTFDQEPFKKEFVLMNQRSRQKAKTSVEKDFYKLMNNSNFGADCRKNIDNCNFTPIFDEINEIQSLRKYYSLFDPKIKKFVSGKLLTDLAENKFNEATIKLDPNDKF